MMMIVCVCVCVCEGARPTLCSPIHAVCMRTAGPSYIGLGVNCMCVQMHAVDPLISRPIGTNLSLDKFLDM